MAEQDSIPQGTVSEWATAMKQAVSGKDPKYNPERQALIELDKQNPGKPITAKDWANHMTQSDQGYLTTTFKFTDLGQPASGPAGPPSQGRGGRETPERGGGGRGGGVSGQTGTDASKFEAPFFTTPLAEGIRKPLESAAGAVTGAIPKMLGAPKGFSEFSTGLGEGLAHTGVNLTSPLNAGIMIGSAFVPESYLSRVPKLAKLVKTLAKTGFAGAQTIDMLKEVSGAFEAYQKGDMREVGKAVAAAVADAALIKTSVSKGKGKAKEAAKETEVKPPRSQPGVSSDPRVTERVNPEHTTAVLEARRAADAKQPGPPAVEVPKVEKPTTPEAIEKRIGELQDKLNLKRGGPRTKEREAMETEIRELRASHPQVARSEHLRGQRTLAQYVDYLTAEREKLPRHSAEFDAISAEIKDAVGQMESRSQVPKTEVAKAGPPEEPPTAITKESQQKRAEDANARAKEPRKPVGDLGYRVAPEETGELPGRRKPSEQPIGTEQPPPAPGPPQMEAPELGTETGAGEAPQYTSEKLPGVPKGSRVIFREQTPQGTQIDVVDPSGRTTQATLPFRDTVENLVKRGWIKASKPIQTFTQAGPPEAPRANVQEIRPDTRGQRGLPAPAAAIPGQKLLESGPHVTPMGPEAGPPPPDPSFVRSVPGTYPPSSNVGPPPVPTAATPVPPPASPTAAGAAPPKLSAPPPAPVPAATPAPVVPKKAAPKAVPPQKKAAPKAVPPQKKAAPLTPPAKITPKPAASPAGPPAASGPAPSQELSQVTASIFQTAIAQGYPQIRIKMLNRAGTEIASDLFDSTVSPEEVAKAVAGLKGVAGFKIEPVGGSGPKTSWSKFLTGRPDAGKP